MTVRSTTACAARLALVCAVVTIVLLGACSREMSQEQLRARAAQIHAQAWTVDTHIDAPASHLGRTEWSALEYHEYGTGQRTGQWDLPRMVEGGLDAVFLVVYLAQRELTPANYDAAYQRSLAQFEWVHDIARRSPIAEVGLNSQDALRLKAEGKRALFIGVENGFPIGTDLGRLQEFYDLGMRYLTLTHSGDNQIAASSGSRGREDFGLTEFGRQVVRELNRLGVMIDLSHVSDQTFYDVLEMTAVPVVLTHSGCRALASSSRNITDPMLEALARNGGVIQLVALGSFVRDTPANPERDRALEELMQRFGDPSERTKADREDFSRQRQEIIRRYPTTPVTIEDYLKHIDHAVAVAGIDHVGFGSDFDGGGGVEGLEDVTKLPELTVELLRRGYSREEIEKFWGGNFLRVMQAVEAAAGG